MSSSPEQERDRVPVTMFVNEPHDRPLGLVVLRRKISARRPQFLVDPARQPYSVPAHPNDSRPPACPRRLKTDPVSPGGF
jgi:hypothetical protein